MYPQVGGKQSGYTPNRKFSLCGLPVEMIPPPTSPPARDESEGATGTPTPVQSPPSSPTNNTSCDCLVVPSCKNVAREAFQNLSQALQLMAAPAHIVASATMVSGNALNDLHRVSNALLNVCLSRSPPDKKGDEIESLKEKLSRAKGKFNQLEIHIRDMCMRFPEEESKEKTSKGDVMDVDTFPSDPTTTTDTFPSDPTTTTAGQRLNDRAEDVPARDASPERISALPPSGAIEGVGALHLPPGRDANTWSEVSAMRDLIASAISDVLKPIPLPKPTAPQDNISHSVPLSEVARFNNARSLSDIGAAAIACAANFCAFPVAALYLFEPFSGDLVMAGSTGFSEEEKVQLLKTALDRHPGKVMRSRKRLHVGDTFAGKREGVKETVKRQLKIRSRLWLPILDNGPSGNVIGAMGYASDVSDFFGSEHVWALEVVVDLVRMSYVTFFHEQKLLKNVGKYLNPVVTNQLLEGKDAILGGVKTLASMMFVDIRDFSSYSEKQPPEKLVSNLNSYFTYISEAVFNNGGTVDKFVGDGMMAVFESNQLSDGVKGTQGQQACIAALDIFQQVSKLEEDTGISLKVGVGVNTGEIVSGNIGCPKFMSQTVIGDHVNCAARFESLTKMYGVGIVVGPSTYLSAVESTSQPSPGLYFAELDTVKVMGRSTVSKLYHLVARSRAEVPEEMKTALDLYAQGYALYLKGQFVEARKLLEKAGTRGYGPGTMMAKRCRDLLFSKTDPTEWDGTWSFKVK